MSAENPRLEIINILSPEEDGIELNTSIEDWVTLYLYVIRIQSPLNHP